MPRTWDHVFPLSWYPESTQKNLEKWKVPVCLPCNNEYSAIEQDLLLRVGLCIDPHAVESAGIVPKVLRSLNPNMAESNRERKAREAKRAQILRQLLQGTDVVSTAIYPNFEEKWGRPPEQQIGVPIPKKAVDRLFEKIIRGIVFLQDGRFIEPPYSIDLYPLKEEDAPVFTDPLNKFGKIYSRPPGVVVRRAVAHEDGVSSIFEIVIWGLFKTYAVVTASEPKATL